MNLAILGLGTAVPNARGQAKAREKDFSLLDFGVVSGDQHLYRHGTHRSRLLGKVDRSHASMTDNTLKGTCA